VGTPKPPLFGTVPITIIILVKFSLIFLLASERRFQRTKEHGIWIPYAKVMKEQSLVLKQFLPHRFIIDFGDLPIVKMVV